MGKSQGGGEESSELEPQEREVSRSKGTSNRAGSFGSRQLGCEDCDCADPARADGSKLDGRSTRTLGELSSTAGVCAVIKL